MREKYYQFKDRLRKKTYPGDHSESFNVDVLTTDGHARLVLFPTGAVTWEYLEVEA